MNILRPLAPVAHLLAALATLCACSPARAQDLSLPGPYQPGWRSMSVQRPNGTTFNARVHYPALSATQNAPIDPAAGPCPAITFGHGFLTPVTQYLSTFDHLATHGLVIIASESQGGLFPSHSAFAVDLRLCLDRLEQANVSAGDPFFGFIDPAAMGASGHSMGGGASMLAAADDPRIIAVANLAAAETSPPASTASASIDVPVALISASQDSITPLPNHGQKMYDKLAGPRTLPNIQGGFHCGFIDSNIPIGCDSGSITRAQQLAITRALLAEFFLLHLAGNDELWPRVWADTGPAGVSYAIDPRVQISPAAPTLSLPQGGSASISFTASKSAGPVGDHAWNASFSAGALVQAQFEPQTTGPLPPSANAPTTLELHVGRAQPVGPIEAVISLRASDGSRAWTPAVISVTCYADCDGSGALNIFDYICFGNAFTSRLPSADCDESNTWNIFDYICFGNAYAAGCP